MPRKSPLPWLVLLLLTASVRGAGAEASYDVHGVLRNFDAGTGQATISHEAISGYMPAMTMDYRVRDPSEMHGLHAGDGVEFTLHVTARDAWIEQVVRTASAPVLAVAPAPPTQQHELEPGDALPDLQMVDDQGRKTDLSAYRGRTLALTFIYSRCPLPTYCPLTNTNFKMTQTLLGQIDPAGPWALVSITLDPAHDTPDVLAACESNLEADPRHWIFASADETALHRFGATLGLEFSTSNGQISHNLRTVVVGPDGRIKHIFKGNSWTPQDLAAEMITPLSR